MTDLASILVQSSVDGLFAVDREQRYTLWNAAMQRFAGKSADEVLGRNMLEVFPFLRDFGLDEALRRALAGETVKKDAAPHAIPGGETHYFDRLYMPLRRSDGEVIGVVGVVRDVTARHRAEEALRASEETLRMAVEASGIGLWKWDVESDEVSWEDPLCAIASVPPGAGPRTRAGYLAMVHPEDRDRAAAVIEAGVQTGGWEGEHRLVRADGTVRWIITKCTVLRPAGRPVALGAVIDVTERRQRDEQLRQAQKLEAVGQLTAGIAHNFNNLLMAMGANLELAAIDAPHALTPLLEDAREAAMRAADLVRQLMTFAGRNRPAKRSVEPISPLIARTLAFYRKTLDPHIAIETRYDAAAHAKVDPAQLEQALVNVLLNARDALAAAPAVADPRISVAVDLVDAYVRICIRDNGPGMDGATQSRVFEPFFTTKDVGKGTGLGLATTHTIIREHGGFVACESQPGQGATFSIHLPAADGPVQTETGLRPSGPVRGRETILVVDDEDVVRHVVARMLASAGYTARVAASGRETLDVLLEPAVADDVALVLLDVSMPGLSGPALRERIAALAPRAHVVYFTGAPFEATDPRDTVLLKPIALQPLLDAVRTVLDRDRA